MKRRWIQALLVIVASLPTIPSIAFAGSGQPGDKKSYESRVRKLAGLSEKRLLGMIARNAPTIAAVIREDQALEQQIGEDKYRTALAQLCLFSESEDPDCQEALRIIGDTVPRTKAKVGAISLNGKSGEWRKMLPKPTGRAWGQETEDRAREFWAKGVAGVVRDQRLYIMAGMTDPDYFDRPNNKLIVRADCIGDPRRDIQLNIVRREGRWEGVCEFQGDWKRQSPKPIPIKELKVAVGKVVEIAMDIDGFAPPSVAKPIWTIYLKARTETTGKVMYPRTRNVPIFNETAEAGVAAGAYVRNLMLLAADVGLRESDLTAAAIAITAATMQATGGDAVRGQLRQDNAALLEFARETMKRQRRLKAEYRLDQYPLEAQLAWANRLIWLGVEYLSWNRARDSVNDLENYEWALVDIDTLRDLHDMATEAGLVDASAAQTAKNIDKWVGSKMVFRKWVHHLPREINRHKDDPARVAELEREYKELLALRESGAATLGYFKGEPVYEVFARNTRAYLALMREKGHFYGGCPDHTWFCQDMMRAVGLAPLAFSVHSSRVGKTGHCWAGFYDPTKRRWGSSQAGRSGSVWWLLDIDRIAIYPYAAMAQRVSGEEALPFPLFYKREMQGRRIKELTQQGIPTKTIRRWMLTPCF